MRQARRSRLGETPRVADPSLVDAAVEWRRYGFGPPLAVERVDAFIEEVGARLDGMPRPNAEEAASAPSPRRRSPAPPTRRS